MTADEVTAFLDVEYPQMNHDGRLHTIENVRSMVALRSDGIEAMVAHAVLTCSIPESGKVA